MRKHIIWTSEVDYKDWKDYLEDEYPCSTEDERIERMYEINSECLDDERCNLDIRLPNKIIAIANLGRWNGRKLGYKIIASGNIKDCLYTDCDYATWYVDKYGEFRLDAAHHDGNNSVIYRGIKDTIRDETVENFCNKIYNHKVTARHIAAVTFPLGSYIADVYGWDTNDVLKLRMKSSKEIYQDFIFA